MTGRKKMLIAGVLLAVAAGLLGAGYYLGVAGKRDAVPADVRGAHTPATLVLPADIELADTPEKQAEGLSGRPLIAEDYGMLFSFDADGHHGFWMKGMLAPIDIVWITKDGVIAHIEHAVEPATYPRVFEPAVPARYVLETRAGYARENGWKEGKRFDMAAYARSE